jgi:spermidine synthase
VTSFGEPIASDGSFANVFQGESLYSGRSDLQKIDVYENAHFGRVLTLDDLVQTTERDEYCYHEMLVHPALASLERVERVLIIGGGDGGTLRHVLMHGPSQVVMCEIDSEVVRVCRELMPSLSDGAFDDPRAQVVFANGAAYAAEHESVFDAVVVDGSDAVGPAAVLFSEAFYAACRRALVPGGVFVSQTGSPLYQAPEFDLALRNLSLAFPIVEPYLGAVPTYPGTLWSYMAATDGDPVSAAQADVVAGRLRARQVSTRYYSPELHGAAFKLPAFVESLREAASPAVRAGRA